MAMTDDEFMPSWEDTLAAYEQAQAEKRRKEPKMGLDEGRAEALYAVFHSQGEEPKKYKTHDVLGPDGHSEARYAVECNGLWFESLVAGLAHAHALAENEWDKLAAKAPRGPALDAAPHEEGGR